MVARPTTAARRYAEAAFELAGGDDSYDRWADDLRKATEATADERVARVIDNPSVPFAERQELLERLLGNAIRRPAFNLVRLLSHRAESQRAESDETAVLWTAPSCSTKSTAGSWERPSIASPRSAVRSSAKPSA